MPLYLRQNERSYIFFRMLGYLSAAMSGLALSTRLECVSTVKVAAGRKSYGIGCGSE